MYIGKYTNPMKKYGFKLAAQVIHIYSQIMGI